jgi:anion-transporting  ArsA/GET3 family ATPase
MVTIGKIWELAQFERRNPEAMPYDLVIVDAPSTGHGLGILRTPRTFRDVARVGPIRRQADKIDAFITDPDTTGIVAVALPEEMPVNETVDFERGLRDEMGMELDLVVVNALYPERFTDGEADRIEQAAESNGSPGVEAALKAALFEHHRARTQRAEVARLTEELGHQPVTLPYLFEPELDLDSFERLAADLERVL